VGVFIDYTALPQRSLASHAPGAEDDRTPEELATFKRALAGINAWYGHRMTHVLLVDTPLPTGDYTNTQPYEGRGWCWMECCASGLVKDDEALIRLSQLNGEEKTYGQVCRNGKSDRKPPRPPAPFADGLASDVERGVMKFTNKGDVGLVSGIYEKAFTKVMHAATKLFYINLRWDDAAGVVLCEALRSAHAHGGLRELERLELSGNKLGDQTAAALAALVQEEGALPKLKMLDLYDNQLGEAGVAALAAAIRGGALPACTEIVLYSNPGSAAPVREAAAQREGMKVYDD